jgi:hypothetical protein
MTTEPLSNRLDKIESRNPKTSRLVVHTRDGESEEDLMRRVQAAVQAAARLVAVMPPVR